jgi:hypothetical protein
VVENLSRLSKLFEGLTEENLPALHALGESRSERDKDWERAWGICKRLGGIHPAILPLDVDARKLGAMSVDKVKEVFQMTEEEMALTLSILQLAWQHLIAASDMPSIASSVQATAPPPPEAPAAVKPAVPSLRAQAPAVPTPDGFSEEEISLLDLATYPTTIFDFQGGMHDKRMEISWFCGRIKEVRKVFEEPMTKALARNALLNELQLRRVNDRLVVMDPADKEFVKLQDTKQQIEKTYGEQWAQIEKLCPAVMATTSRKESLSTLAEIISLYLDYNKNPDNAPRDGIFTDDEIQVLFRTSQQMPETRYRLGWVLACNEAKRALGDPKYKRKLSTTQCRILDTSFAHAFGKISDHMKNFKPDLELDGPHGEYPPMHLERDGEITEPDPSLLEDVGGIVETGESDPEPEPATPQVTPQDTPQA